MKINFFIRSFLLLVLAFVAIKSLVFGTQGVDRYFEVKNEIKIQKDKIVRLNNKIADLNNKITSWLSDDFELEKMAREELQMGYPSEKLYLLKNTSKK